MINDNQCYKITTTVLKENLNFPDKNVLHVAYGIDKNFERPMYTSMASVAKNTKSKIIFHVFGEEVLYLKEKLIDFCEELNTTIYLHEIDGKQFDKWATDGWSSAIYQRLVMAPVISKYSEFFLYLDADTICQDDIACLFKEKMDDAIIAAVKDPDQTGRKIDKNNDLSGVYFNSGVLVINAEKWCRENITNKLCVLLSKSSHTFKAYDQDALNIVLKNDVFFIDKKYNFPADTNSHPFIKKIIKDSCLLNPFIIHYMGKEKPWLLGNEKRKDTNIYLSYENFTPYKDEPLQLPRGRRETKKCAKYMSKKLKIFSALYWWSKYINIKICGKK